MAVIVNKDWEALISLTSLIFNKTIREMTIKALEDTPLYFRTAPSSVSGMHHPKYALGEGGLVRHTIAVVKMANHICSLDFLRIDSMTRDRILSACFLHDTRKQGCEAEGDGRTRRDHPKLASDTVEDVEISRMILSHMGQWGNNKPGTMPQFIVHLADYLASRKDIEVQTDGIDGITEERD